MIEKRVHKVTPKMVRDFLTSMGFDPEYVLEARIDPEYVEVMYGHRESGTVRVAKMPIRDFIRVKS